MNKQIATRKTVQPETRESTKTLAESQGPRSTDRSSAAVENQATEMLSVVRSIFEEKGGYPDLQNLGLPSPVLRSALRRLVAEYIAAGSNSQALRAAALTKEPSQYRKVFAALKNEAPRVATGDFCGHFQPAIELQEAVLGTRDPQLIKAYAAEKIVSNDYRDAVDALRSIKDSPALLKLGREIFAAYLTARERDEQTHAWSGKTESLIDDAFAALKAARELGQQEAAAGLVALGEVLQKNSPDNKRYEGNSSSELHAVDAYEAAGVQEGYEAAGKLYLEMSRQRHSLKTAKQDLVCAARCFTAADDSDQTMLAAKELAAAGELGEAVAWCYKALGKADVKAIKNLQDAALQKQITRIREEILKYLEDKNNPLPFPTAYTFWHFSQSNGEWDEYAGRIDVISGKGGFLDEPAHARALHSSDQYRDKIQAIHQLLKKHLVMGHLLSGLSFEKEHGSRSHDRKYEHAGYAAWRTFSYAFHGQGYSPFGDELRLSQDPLFKEAYAAAQHFADESSKLCVEREGWLCQTYESRQYRRANVGAVQEKILECYKRLHAEIQQQVTAL